jgi:hypothetical protein
VVPQLLPLLLLVALLSGRAAAADCPATGAALSLSVELVEGAGATTNLLSGTLEEPSCDGDATLATSYEVALACDPIDPPSCRGAVSGLRPGRWVHRVETLDGEAGGRLQARRALLLDAAAGVHDVGWPTFRNVQTVDSLVDAVGCSDCLRAALTAADTGLKPALLQFAPDLAGTIALAAPLPPLAGGALTIDGFDAGGRPYTRGIDANGLNGAALRITSAGNVVEGLRLANVGGDSDTLLIEGSEANANRIDTVVVLGRAVEPCLVGETIGCRLGGECVVPGPGVPRGACGDDGIAVRDFAGAAAVNLIRNVDVRGARDKGIKASDRGVARVERSLLTGNADGGLQATLGGTLTAIENEVRTNRGTPTASGIAANGAAVGSLAPAVLETRGNLVVDNALRGLSVRSLSLATLRDDFVCGNGTPGRADGFGVAILDAAGRSARADLHGLALVHNLGGGAVVGNASEATFGTPLGAGHNAFAWNGAGDPLVPVNLRNETTHAIEALGNHWEHCGARIPCDLARVRARDIFRISLAATVAIAPALATPLRRAPVITAIEPPFAAAGELVRIYGSGFDAIDGAGDRCGDIEAANGCRPVRGNCVFIDRQPAAVVAVTPTMLVVRAPFTCVEPVSVAARTRRSRGFGRATFCQLPPA